MPDITEIRKQYPQYGDLSDQGLADLLHDKFYSDIPRGEFNKRLGLPPPPQAEIKPYEPTKRDMVAGWMLSLPRGPHGEPREDSPSEAQKWWVNKIVGSEGLGTTGVGALDFTPAGIVFGVDEMQRGVKQGGLSGAAEALLGATSVIPAAGPELAGAKRYIPRGRGFFGATETMRENAASGRVAGAMQEHLATLYPQPNGKPRDPRTVSPQEMYNVHFQQNLRYPHADLRTVDVTGLPGRRLAKEVSNKSGRADQTIRPDVHERYEGQTERVLNWFDQAFTDPEHGMESLEAMREKARQPTTEAYEKAFGSTKATAVISPDLDRMLHDPAWKEIFDKANDNWAKREAAGVAGPHPRGVGNAPSLAWWDQVKRVIDDRVTGSKVERPAESMMWNELRKSLIKALDDAVPEYAVARGLAADTFDAANAFEAGQNLVKGKWTGDEIKEVFKGMTPEERAMVQSGFLYDFVRDVRYSPDRTSLVRKIQNSEGERMKIEAVLGPGRANELAVVMEGEALMELTRAEMGNSSTVRQGLDVMKGEPGVTLPMIVSAAGTMATGDWKGMFAGALLYAAQKHNLHVSEDIAARVAEKLMSPDRRVFAEGVKEITGNSNLRRALSIAAQIARPEGAARTLDRPKSDPIPINDPKDALYMKPGTWVRLPNGSVRQVRFRDQSGKRAGPTPSLE